jgi:hypothetical protein
MRRTLTVVAVALTSLLISAAPALASVVNIH